MTRPTPRRVLLAHQAELRRRLRERDEGPPDAEGRDQGEIRAWAQEIVDVVKTTLG